MRFEAEPKNFKSLHVQLVRDGVRWWEETRTNSLRWRETGKWEPTKPSGIGWRLYADNGEHCVWRRTRRAATPLLKANATMAEVYYRKPERPELPLGA